MYRMRLPGPRFEDCTVGLCVVAFTRCSRLDPIRSLNGQCPFSQVDIYLGTYATWEDGELDNKHRWCREQHLDALRLLPRLGLPLETCALAEELAQPSRRILDLGPSPLRGGSPNVDSVARARACSPRLPSTFHVLSLPMLCRAALCLGSRKMPRYINHFNPAPCLSPPEDNSPRHPRATSPRT